MNPHRKKSEDEYSRTAALYDPLLGPFLRPIRRDVVALVSDLGCGRVLDICCGSGQQCIMLERFGFPAAGVDLSRAMLNQARRKSPPAISYFLANAAHLCFKDGSFDCAIISFALHEKDPLTRAGIILEANRTLSDTGKIIVVDYVRPEGIRSIGFMNFVDLIERIAGREHHENYRLYMRAHALERLFTELNMKVTILKTYFMRTVALALAEKPGQGSGSDASG